MSTDSEDAAADVAIHSAEAIVIDRPRWRRGRALSDGSKLYWWRELLIVVVVDLVYETVRNMSSAKPEKAYRNAERLIQWQRDLGIWHEHAIQQWALDVTPLVIVANYFYGSAYIAATIFGLVFLYRWHSDDYPLWRNTLAIGTLLGLIGFATFPLMPPRLLDVMGPAGHNWDFVDTLLVESTTPIDEETTAVDFAFSVRKLANADATRGVGASRQEAQEGWTVGAD